MELLKELEKVSKQEAVHVAVPPGRACPWSTSRCQDIPILSCSTAGGAETRGQAGISVLCPCPQPKQRERGKRRVSAA